MLRASLLSVLLSFALFVLRARAESDVSANDYRKAIELAMEAYSAGDYRVARMRFDEAHRLQPSARTLRALGAVSYELGDYVAATEYLGQALRSNVQRLDDALREESERLLREARAHVAVVELALTPASARVTVDDRTTAERHLVLEPGAHQLKVEAQEHRGQETGLVVAAGEHRTLTIRLERDRGREPARDRDPAAAPERSLLAPRLTIALATTTLALGAGLLVASRFDQQRVEEAKDGSRWPGDAESAYDRGPKLARAGIALSAIGAAALAAGITLRLVAGAREAPRVSVSPRGFAVVQRF